MKDYKKIDENISLFSLAKINKYYLFPFLTPIVCFSTKFFIEPIKERLYDKNKNINQDDENTFVFLYTLINSLSFILAGLLYFISNLKAKTENPESEKKQNKIKKELNIKGTLKSDDTKRRIKIFLVLFFMSFILTIYTIIKGYAMNNKTLEKRLYLLFFITIFNKPFLKLEIYKHQKFSLCIAGLGLAILFIVFFFEVFQYNLQYNVIYDILLLIGSFFYSLYLVLAKLLTQNYMSPFLYILIIGIISTILTLIGYSLFSLIIKGNFSYIINIFKYGDVNNPLYFNYYYLFSFLYFILMAFLQVCIILVIYYFTPAIFAMSDIISPMFSWLKNRIENKDSTAIVIIFNILGYLIIIIAALIYNEIITCNFLGLNENTWKAIDERARIELKMKTDKSVVEVDGYYIDTNNNDNDNDNYDDDKDNINIIKEQNYDDNNENFNQDDN